MAHIAPEITSDEYAGPLEYVGIDAVRTVCAAGLADAPDGVSMDTPGLTVRVSGDLAVSWGIDRVRVTQSDGSTTEERSRSTRVLARLDETCLMVHQHLSVPAEA